MDKRAGELTRGDIKQAIHDELREFHSLRKNGETWWQWAGKLVTPERVLLLLVAIFTLGGRAQRLETASVEALETAKSVAGANAKLMDEVASMRKVIDSQAAIIERQETMHATKAGLSAVDERVKLLVTRQEMRRFLNEELIPRLARIERQGRP